MRPQKAVSYEVQVAKDNRWTIESVHPSKGRAVKQAEALLGANTCEAVKVIEEKEGWKPKVIFEQRGTIAEKPLTIATIDDAHFCVSVDDLFSFQARLTAARLLRPFLDDIGATAFELLYDYGRLRQLIRNDTLFYQALHRVSALQSRGTDTKPADRFDFIQRAVNEIAEKARENDDVRHLYDILKSDGIMAMVRTANEEYEEPYAAYLMPAAVALMLGEDGDWNGKLGLALDHVEKGATGKALEILDEAMAEILDGGEAIMNMLGGQADLGTALKSIGLLLQGKAPGQGGRGSVLPRLNAVLPKTKLPRTCEILLGRIEKGLRGIKPLTKEDAKADRAAFLGVLDSVIAPGGLRGGRGMAEAVTLRASIAFGGVGTGDLGPEECLARMPEVLPNRAVMIGYLLDLGSSPFGAKNRGVVLKRLADTVKDMGKIESLLPPGASPAELRAAAVDLSGRLAGDMLPPEWQAELAKRFEKMLAGAPPEPPKALEVPSEPPPAPPPDKCKLMRGHFKSGEIIFKRGEAGDAAYLVTSGEVEIVVPDRTGKPKVISTLSRGDIFGEMALITHAPRVATARAKTDVVLSGVPMEAFQARLDRLAEFDKVLRSLIDMFASRLSNVTDDVR